jgi:hypothetical protein
MSERKADQPEIQLDDKKQQNQAISLGVSSGRNRPESTMQLARFFWD